MARNEPPLRSAEPKMTSLDALGMKNGYSPSGGTWVLP